MRGGGARAVERGARLRGRWGRLGALLGACEEEGRKKKNCPPCERVDTCELSCVKAEGGAGGAHFLRRTGHGGSLIFENPDVIYIGRKLGTQATPPFVMVQIALYLHSAAEKHFNRVHRPSAWEYGCNGAFFGDTGCGGEGFLAF